MVMRIFPKVGPLKGLRFDEPGKEAEKLFVQSFDRVLVRYATFLNKIAPEKSNWKIRISIPEN